MASPIRVKAATRVHVPCTVETARCPEARNYGADTPDCCREHIRHVVFTVGDALTEAGIPWWLDYGSLLGAYRNPLLKACKNRKHWVCAHPNCPPAPLPGGLIPFDKDADCGFLAADWERFLALGGGEWSPANKEGERFKSALGLRWVHRLPRGDMSNPQHVWLGGDSLKIQRSEVNHSNCDYFAWHERKDGKLDRRRYVGVDKNKGRALPKDWVFPLGTIEWEGRMLPCPREVEKTVSHRYPDWHGVLRRNNWGRRVN